MFSIAVVGESRGTREPESEIRNNCVVKSGESPMHSTSQSLFVWRKDILGSVILRSKREERERGGLALD